MLLIERNKKNRDIALIEAFKIMKEHNTKVMDRITFIQNDPKIQQLVPIIDNLLNSSLDQVNNEDKFIEEGKSYINFLDDTNKPISRAYNISKKL